METMDQNKALGILIQIAHMAQAKGVLTLQDAVIVNAAVNVFTPKEEQPAMQVAEPEQEQK